MKIPGAFWKYLANIRCLEGWLIQSVQIEASGRISQPFHSAAEVYGLRARLVIICQLSGRTAVECRVASWLTNHSDTSTSPFQDFCQQVPCVFSLKDQRGLSEKKNPYTD